MQRGRKSIRLSEFDYSSPGAYFVTVATNSRKAIFGSIEDNHVVLSQWGKIAEDCWRIIPEHFTLVELDEFIVMPNHVHGILWIQDPMNAKVGARHASPLRRIDANSRLQAARGARPNSLGAIIGSYKSAVTKAINELTGIKNTIWHRNYYDHVIRDETDLEKIQSYIVNNAIPHK